MTSDGTVEKRYVGVLTPMRGIAALVIVLFHASVAFQSSQLALDRVDLLKSAVTFFFVLSGFVLTLSWGQHAAARFWWRRIARLLPLYMFAWLFTLAGRSFVHWEPSQLDLGASLVLVQAWFPGEDLPMAVNPPAWSLSCEALFYLVLPFAAPHVLGWSAARGLRVATAAVAAWLGIAVALSSVWPLEWWAGYRGAEFAAGVLLAAHIRAGWRPGTVVRRAALLSCSIILALGATGLATTGPVANLIALPAFIAVVAIAATSTRRLPWLDNSLTQAMGRWSYSLYITHWIVVILMSRFLTSPVWIPAALTLCVLVAAVLHHLVERPSERRLLMVTGRPEADVASARQPAHLR